MNTAMSAETTPDYDEIVRVVQLYVDGFQGGINKLEEAFHEDAWIFAIDAEGELGKGLVSDRFERWAASRRPVRGRVIQVTQAGQVASVLLGFDNTEELADSWVDVLALLKLGGTWKITHKSAVHSSRAAWAKPQ
ncbi:nuclear transport factor 2 family protein [Halomonas sp. CKK8]|uniref:nuclear transport factor 2 family protein n=1 Tax=Halomonas sp. CKK8 TaxID=3036127 RepID=UPI00241531BF|nr:nuclear transport factor 2 family protein [Halomonas sp. CKK8]WFM71680.1 nuclear transport factor 2 family protein [Halomonas sp. CKK8]